jgi:hypothetical protein
MDNFDLTAFGGRLIRWAENVWAWSDHTPEPRVKDMTMSWYHNFRISGGCVEVPVKSARSEPELAWVLHGRYRKGLSGDRLGCRVIHADGRITRLSTHGKAIPEVFLVPVEDWDEHDTVIGAKWDENDEDAILIKAKALGWEPTTQNAA